MEDHAVGALADLACRTRREVSVGRLPAVAGRAGLLGRAAHQRAVGAASLFLAGGHRHKLTENMRFGPRSGCGWPDSWSHGRERAANRALAPESQSF